MRITLVWIGIFSSGGVIWTKLLNPSGIIKVLAGNFLSHCVTVRVGTHL
jgi:hypothetical protein